MPLPDRTQPRPKLPDYETRCQCGCGRFAVISSPKVAGGKRLAVRCFKKELKKIRGL